MSGFIFNFSCFNEPEVWTIKAFSKIPKQVSEIARFILQIPLGVKNVSVVRAFNLQ